MDRAGETILEEGAFGLGEGVTICLVMTFESWVRGFLHQELNNYIIHTLLFRLFLNI